MPRAMLNMSATNYTGVQQLVHSTHALYVSLHYNTTTYKTFIPHQRVSWTMPEDNIHLAWGPRT